MRRILHKKDLGMTGVRINRRRLFLRAALEALEPRVLLSALTADDISGTWSFSGMGATGSIQFDNAGNIAGGSLAFSDGSGDGAPTGTYGFTPGGGFSINAGQSTLSGAVDASRELAVVTNFAPPGDSFSNSLGVAVKTGASDFTNADIAGKWWMFIDGDTTGSTGMGDITFDAAGNVTVASISSGDGSTSITSGSYTLSSTGQVSVLITVNSHGGGTNNFTLQGQMNASKNTFALSPPDIATAAANNDVRLLVGIKQTTGFSTADLAGAWNFEGDGLGGSLSFDGHGKITGGGVNTKGDAISISGTYSISSEGFLTASLRVASPNGNQTYNDHGWLNGSKTAAALEPPPSNALNNASNDSLLMLVKSGDAAPVLTSISPFGTATAGNDFNAITYASIASHGNATDADGDTVSFFVASLGNGTLSLNGNPVTAGEFISTGDSLTWTPPANASGAVTAFSVKAYDGVVFSSASVPVVVNTVLPPTVSIKANKSKASELNDGVRKGIGQYTITRVHGDLSQPLTVFYSDNAGAAVDGSDFNALPGSITLGANVTSATITLVPVPDSVSEPTETAILSLTPTDTYAVNPKKGSATVSIADVEYPPDSLAGLTLKVSAGASAGSFADTGNYQLVFSGSDNRYLRVGGIDDLIVPGNFTYHHMTSTASVITLDDSNLGTVQGTLTFTSPTAVTFNFGSLSGSQSGKITLATPKATIAPVDLAGRSGNLTIKGGHTLPSKGSLQLILSQNSSQFISAGTSPVASSFGTYTYERFAPNVALLTVDDSANANGLVVLQFTSATSAAYSSRYMSDATERGKFSLNAIPKNALVPAAFTGDSLAGKISRGSGLFPAKGAFTQAFQSDTYGISGTLTATGSYTLETMTPTIALLTLHDSTGGPEHEVVTFTSDAKATVLLFGDTSGSYLNASVAVT